MKINIILLCFLIVSSLNAIDFKEVEQMSDKLIPGTKKVSEMKYKDTVYFITFDDSGKKSGYIIITSVKGYAGPIKVIAGMDKEGKVINYFLNHNETKEYYDLIKKSDFKERCKGKKKDDLILRSTDNKKGKIDAVTGATITCQSILSGLQEAVKFLEKIQKTEVKEDLFK